MTGMAAVLSVALSGVLVVIAALHLLWALGFWWPIRDETELARAVVGGRGITHMPGALPCAIVAVALAFFASLPWTPLFPMQANLMFLIALVFLVRGAVTYLPAWRRLRPAEPFARLDRRVYGPLCLAIGAGFLFLVINGGTL